MIDANKKSIEYIIKYMINNVNAYMQAKWLQEAISQRGYRIYDIDYIILVNCILSAVLLGEYKDKLLFKAKNIIENDTLCIYEICIVLGTGDKIIIDAYLYEYRRINNNNNNTEVYYMLNNTHNIPEWRKEND